MIASILYVILAILGLSFLIFIHELGHYYMARRVGMRVETFAIGFGKPIFSWERDGVKWQIGWLLFGGYVKIAGQDLSDKKDPYEVPGGFFSKRPIDQVMVAAAGPIVNLVAALVIFTLLWAIGGREKNFSEFTKKIGWVDPASELYAFGVRPGDEIVSYNDQTFQSSKDHLYAPMTSAQAIDVKGMKVSELTGEKTPFDYQVKTYPHPNVIDKGIVTSGILNSANYIVYGKLGSKENPLPEGSPLEKSGIQYGDRIVWVDGEVIYSGQQLSRLLNDGKALLTVQRDDNAGKKILQVRVPRVLVGQLKLDAEVKDELTDWQYEAGLNSTNFTKISYIPYNLTNNAVVENELKFIDQENALEAFPKHPFSSIEAPLLPKDKIIAIDGSPITSSYDLLQKLQSHHVNVIVERGVSVSQIVPSDQADAAFDQAFHPEEIGKIVATIGSASPVTNAGSYTLLPPVEPKRRGDFVLGQEAKALQNTELLKQKKEVQNIDDANKRSQLLAHLEAQEKQLLLGLPLVQDVKLRYNPNPIAQFNVVFNEVWHTLKALFTGALNPKWMSGPIGIIRVVHDSSMVSLKESLFWLGAISLNLGMLNLLPIPVLDGGMIALSFFEIITRRRIHPSILEKVVLPFAVILIGFFIFLTYQDLSSLLSRFVSW